MTAADPPNLSQVRAIFVRAPNWVGDWVMATASFHRLRAAFPRAHITVGMRPYLRPLLSGADWFDAVVDTPRAGGLRGLFAQVAAVRAARCDLAVVLPNSLETGLVPFLARVPLRLGYRQGRSLLLNLGRRAAMRRRFWQRRQGPSRWPTPMPSYYAKLLDCLGIPGSSEHPHLSVTADETNAVAVRLAAHGIGAGDRLVLVVVGANFGASKLWLPERFSATARHFQSRGLRALVVVGPGEVDLGRQIAAAAGVPAMVDPVLPLNQLKALVQRSALMITGDTGPRHLAVAFDKPVVCLIGPTDPHYTNYCLERTVLIQKAELPCVPCQRKVCPLGHHRCMRDITVDEVVAAGEDLLRRFPAELVPG
jgi:heptosyltransferase-2